nr:MAG TPA: hypothetical protein [Caudoviricetes sp.]
MCIAVTVCNGGRIFPTAYILSQHRLFVNT